MYLHTILTPVRVVVPMETTALRESIATLVQRLTDDGAIADLDEAPGLVEVIATRDPVRVGDDAVIAHLRTEIVEELVIALGITTTSPHIGRARQLYHPPIVALVLAPPGEATRYLQAISALAKLLREPGVVEALHDIERPDQLLELREIRDLEIQPRLTVRDIMVHRAPSVSADTSVREAVDLMIGERVRAIPVVGEKDEVLGIVSEWELMRALLPHLPRAGEEDDEGGGIGIPSDLEVREIMSRSVLCIDEEMGIDEAANMMINKDVEQFPVVREGRLSGLLTRGEIIRKLFGR